jgi:hypothetical protein
MSFMVYFVLIIFLLDYPKNYSGLFNIFLFDINLDIFNINVIRI